MRGYDSLAGSISLFRKFVLRDCLHNYVRTIITICGITLGVSVFLAIGLANKTALASFHDTVDKVAGKANLEIRPLTGRTIDQSILNRLTWLEMAGAVYTPIINDDVVLASGADHSELNELIQLLAVDFFADDAFKGYEVVSPDSSEESGAQLNGVFKHLGVLVGHALAAERNLSEGDKIELAVDDRRFEVVVSGVLTDKGTGAAYGGRLLLCDLSLGQEILGLPGQISQVEIISPPQKLELLQEKLRSELPVSVAVEPASTRTSQIEKMTRSFEYNLYALSFIALLVGMFLIYNTMAITVIRRRPELGTLRTLGLSSRHILGLILSEAILLGAVGSLLGLFCGVLIADWALQAVAMTYQRLYFSLPLDSVRLEPIILLIAFFTGVGLTTIAAVPAALEAAAVSPAEATRKMSIELNIDRWTLPFAMVALIFFGLSAYSSTLPALANFPFFGYFSALTCVFGVAFLMPAILKKLLPVLGRILYPLLGLESRLAVSSLGRTLGRSSVAVATLSIGIAMLISLAIMIGSFRETVIDWARQTLVADLWMRPASRDGGSKNARFPAELEGRLATVVGVKAVEPWTESDFEYAGMKATLGAARFDLVEKFSNLSYLSGRGNREVAALIRGKNCIVSESFSIKHGVLAGDTIEVPFKTGLIPIKVQDVYYDYVNDTGFVVVNRDFYRENMKEDGINSFAIFVKEGYEPVSVRKQIFAQLSGKSRFVVRTTGELRERILDIFDQTFAVTYALHAISIVVAILSVMNALFALTEESRREFGILKYIGLSAKGIKKMVLTEAGVLGLSGCVFGIMLGFVLSLLLIYVINKQSFGWTIRFTVPYDFIAETFAIIMFTSIASGLIPARLASATQAPEVIRSE